MYINVVLKEYYVYYCYTRMLQPNHFLLVYQFIKMIHFIPNSLLIIIIQM